MAEHFRDIAKRLIGKTEDKKYSYRDLEIQTGYTFGYIQKVVTGKKELPKNSEFYSKIAKAIHINPSGIIEYNKYKAMEKVSESQRLSEDIASYDAEEAAQVLEQSKSPDILTLQKMYSDMPEEERHQILEAVKKRWEQVRKSKQEH